MGTEIPDLIIYPPSLPGTACSLCWGVGKPFGTGQTPIELHVKISGVNRSADYVPALGEEVNGNFTLTQTSLTACQWQYFEDDIFIEYRYDVAGTFLDVLNAAGFRTFLYGSLNPCEIELANIGTFGFEGGSAVVTIPEVQA